MDTTYRDDLKEINELNFARFDAKVEQRFAKQDARIERRFAEVGVELARMEAKFESGLKEQTRWMVGAWLSLMLTIIGLWFRG